jgi:NodT family efflux transporter outer membrane factor (OMF) lipoprotein
MTCSPKVRCLSSILLEVLLLGLLIAITGCSNKIGPDYEAPTVEVENKWLEDGDTHLKMTDGDFRTWWKIFKDPVLDHFIDKAYAQNLTLRIAGLRILEARAELGMAIGDLYPQKQDFNGMLEDIRTPLFKKIGLGNSLLYSRIGLTANWEFDIWGKFRRAIESSDASLLAAVAEYDNTLLTLIGDVANSYVQIRTYEKRLQIAENNVSIQMDSVRIATSKFRGGSSTQRDVEQAKTILASTQASIPALRAKVRQYKNALSLLLGTPPDRFDHVVGFAKGDGHIPAPPVQVVVGIPQDLLRRRPDIRQAELLAISESAKIGVAKANLYPAFSLSGSFGFVGSNTTGTSLSDMFSWGNQFYRFGPAVQWNLFNYGQITNQVRGQDAVFQEALVSYQEKVLKAQKETEDALIGFLMTQNSAEYLAESTAAAQRSLNLAQLQYTEGITDFTTVLTAEQELLKQQDNFAQTLGLIATSLIDVYRNLGGGWQIREGKEFVPEPIREAMANRTNWGDLLSPGKIPEERPTSFIRAPDW